MAEMPFVDLKTQYARLKPVIDANIQAVLDHGGYIMGPEIGRLEAALAEFTGARNAITVSSGTDALLIPLMAAGIGPGDAVFVPGFTYTATAEVILLLGATPVFVDVEEATFNIDPDDLDRRVAAVREAGALQPRAVIAVDLFGLAADYARLASVAASHDLLVVGDAAQSFGAKRDNRRVGTLAPVTATSFFPAKPLGCYGDGGAIFTDDDALAATMRSIRLHGQGREKYEVVRVGINGRLDTIQAAVLLGKLTVFEDELQKRDQAARSYTERLSGRLATPRLPQGCFSAWAQYTLLVEERDHVQMKLRDLGIPTMIYYPRPMHLQPAYRAYGAGEGSLPVSEGLCPRVLSLPMHPYLSTADIDRVSEAVLRSTR